MATFGAPWIISILPSYQMPNASKPCQPAHSALFYLFFYSLLFFFHLSCVQILPCFPKTVPKDSSMVSLLKFSLYSHILSALSILCVSTFLTLSEIAFVLLIDDAADLFRLWHIVLFFNTVNTVSLFSPNVYEPFGFVSKGWLEVVML